MFYEINSKPPPQNSIKNTRILKSQAFYYVYMYSARWLHIFLLQTNSSEAEGDPPTNEGAKEPIEQDLTDLCAQYNKDICEEGMLSGVILSMKDHSRRRGHAGRVVTLSPLRLGFSSRPNLKWESW